MKRQTSYLFILLYGLSVGYTGCRQTDQHVPHPDISTAQVVLDAYKDTFTVNPRAVIDTLRKVQLRLTDSVTYYKLYNQIAKSYYYANLTDSCFAINKRVIDFYERNTKTTEAMNMAFDAYNTRGVILSEFNQKDSSIVCYLKACELAEISNRKRDLPNIYINLADAYQTQGNYAFSSYYYRKALSLSDSLQMGKAFNLPIMSGIAKLYHELENFDLADFYYKEAAQNMEEQNVYSKFFFINSYGTYHFFTKQYDKALTCFRQAKHYADEAGSTYLQSISAANIGEIFIGKEQPDSARYYLDSASKYGEYELRNQTSFRFYMNGLYASLALLENNLTEAEKLLMQPYDPQSIQPQYLYYHHKRLHEFYLMKKDFKKAYGYYKLTVAYDDSLRNMRIRNNIAEIDSRYRQDTILIRKDMQIALTESKVAQWQNIAFSSITSLVLFITLVTGLILYRRKLRELKYQKQVATITGLRMEIVRNRLSPHFIFNALNTVMPTLENYKELQEPFRLLIQVLRNNLQASEQTAIPLENEVMLVKDYLKLQSLKNDTQISILWEIEPNVPTQTLIPSMCIQIPVENAVKYAFTSASVGPYIRIHIALEGTKIIITIEDNGAGYNVAAPMNDKRGTGSGLKMLYRTIEILNTKNDEKMSFSIVNRKQTEEQAEGTRVSVTVPIHYTFKL